MAELNKVFSVSKEIPQSVSLTLSLQVGQQYLLYSLTDSVNKSLYELQFYKFLGWNQLVTDELDNAISSFVSKIQFTKLSFTDDEFILTDVSQHNNELPEQIFNAQFPKRSNCQFLTDSILNWQIYQTVPVNTISHAWVNKFPNIRYFSPLKLSLSNLLSVGVEGKIKLEFGLSSFNLVLVKSNRLLLCQAFPYANAADVLYYLQSVVQEFGLNNSSVHVEIAGLVDANSPLYKELYQYYLQISFRESHWKDQQEEIPMHYFTTLNELSLCE
jgi:hypothetical protein